MAGTIKTGPWKARSSVVRRSAASPWAAWAMKFAVAGATRNRSAHLAVSMWWVPKAEESFEVPFALFW